MRCDVDCGSFAESNEQSKVAENDPSGDIDMLTISCRALLWGTNVSEGEDFTPSLLCALRGHYMTSSVESSVHQGEGFQCLAFHV